MADTGLLRRPAARDGEPGRAFDASAAARRELVLAAVTAVALSRLADGPAVWLAAVLLAMAVGLGTVHVLAGAAPADAAPAFAARWFIPAVAGLASVGVIRLVPVGLALVPALAAAAVLIDRTIRTEGRLAVRQRDPTDPQRATILVESVVVAFLAFLGVAALVPGGLPEPGGAVPVPMSEGGLALLAATDAAIAGLLGLRAWLVRGRPRGAALWAAATYAAVVAIAAAGIRATEIPRLVGPALLTLVLFLWDAFQGAPPARRRDPRWIWQALILLGLGVVVVAWNLALR